MKEFVCKWCGKGAVTSSPNGGKYCSRKCNSDYHYYNETQERKDQKRDYQLKRRYGINLKTYEKMLVAQNYRCDICGSDSPGKGRNILAYFCVDHCHQTGKVRGLLCHSCNIGISKFNDSVDIMEAAIDYIKKSRQ